MTMNKNSNRWHIERKLSVSVFLQLVVLASLIVSSWINIQTQLDLLQRDVTMLLNCQKEYQQKLDGISQKSISYEYRLNIIERQLHMNEEENTNF